MNPKVLLCHLVRWNRLKETRKDTPFFSSGDEYDKLLCVGVC